MKLVWVGLYAIAMAYLESAVVVYLREIYYPQGFSFPIVILPRGMAAIEIGREAATLVMLLAVSFLATADRWQRFLVFALSFGLWDVFYYVWLWVFIGWPPSLLTWDILFLIPLPWIGPVMAPVLVSLALIVGSLILIQLQSRGLAIEFRRLTWAAAILGGGLVLTSFMADYQAVAKGLVPGAFRWKLFGAGFSLAGGALALDVRRLVGRRSRRPRH